jgi:hypothetical protein
MITTQRVIRAERSHVWKFLGDLESWDELLPTIDEIERLDGPGPVTVGSRFRVRQPGLAEATYEITDWRPGRAFAWQATMRGVRTVATHDLRSHGADSRLTLGIAWHGPLAGLVRLAFGRKTQRFVAEEAAALARLAEGDT